MVNLVIPPPRGALLAGAEAAVTSFWTTATWSAFIFASLAACSALAASLLSLARRASFSCLAFCSSFSSSVSTLANLVIRLAGFGAMGALVLGDPGLLAFSPSALLFLLFGCSSI